MNLLKFLQQKPIQKNENVYANKGWISTKKNLPEEPNGELESIETIEAAIEDGRILEYIVTISNAARATTLYYTGNGFWFDLLTEEFYPVIAWQPLPEIYY